MKVLDPGHRYLLDSLDGDGEVELVFVKRVGDSYPGNEGPPHPGCTTQEVLRALIDRTQYVDRQRHWPENEKVIQWLRMSIQALESRAAAARGISPAQVVEDPELLPVCHGCGHTFCDEDCERSKGH